METKATVEAQPYEFTFYPTNVALLVIDMQRDFVMPGGFGESLGIPFKLSWGMLAAAFLVGRCWSE